MDNQELQKIKETTELFLAKMTLADFTIQVVPPSHDAEQVVVSLTLQEPQVLIGVAGQTLLEVQRILKMIITKQLKRNISIQVDINGYREKKVNYLKSFAQDIANEVSFTQKAKILSPMPPYQRRIIHVELASRQDVTTQSEGSGNDRFVVISPNLS